MHLLIVNVEAAVMKMAPPPTEPDALLLDKVQLINVIMDALAPIAPPAPVDAALAVLLVNVHEVAVTDDDVVTYIPPYADATALTVLELIRHCVKDTTAEL